MKRPRKRASSVAVIDIGSNSVRLVVYEKMARSLITIFNEKALCGLGREVQTTGLLAPDAVAKALTSLRRFRALCRVMKVGRVYAIATAACRDASNGPDFIARAERICGCPIEILSGPREAQSVGAGRGFRHPQAGRHRRRSRRRFAGTDRRAWQPRSPRRDAAARQSGAAGRVAEIAEARRAHRQDGSCRRRTAQGRPRPHLLCGRRHLAGAGAHPHHPERLSAAGDARLFDPGGGRARFRAAAAPAGGGQHAGRYRSRSPTPAGRC